MATRTSYLKLIKPGYDDAADVADLNANMDTIDRTIKTIDEDGSKSLVAHNAAEDAHTNRLFVSKSSGKPTAMADKGIWIELLDD